jgi:hypothetical protein
MIDTGIATAAKLLFLETVAQHKCMIALYTGEASIGPNTKRYTPVGEVDGKGYKAGGQLLRNGKAWTQGDAACLTWDNAVWQNATITAGGFMIYDASEDNTVLFVGSWGSNYSSTNGPFTVNIAEDQITFS